MQKYSTPAIAPGSGNGLNTAEMIFGSVDVYLASEVDAFMSVAGLTKLTGRIDELEKGLRDLDRAYVRLLESGRDRIISLGGDCDPVDVMERGDPYLRQARSLMGG